MEFCCFLAFLPVSQVMLGILHLKTDVLNYKEFQIASCLKAN